MDIAAATVGFVGLSGQILQGCNYLCKIFSDAGDAPEVIRDISKELCNLRSQLEAFQQLLLKTQNTSPASLILQQDPAILLQSCHDAIQKLQGFVDRYADISTPTGTNSGSPQTRREVVRKAWHKFDVARKGDKLRWHKSQLEAAKTSLLFAQTSIQFEFGWQNFERTGQIRDLITDVHTEQKNSHHSTQMTKASVDQVLANSQTLLTQSAASEKSAHAARVTLNGMEDTLASLGTNLRNGFDNLPAAMVAVIQDTIEKSLAKHNASGQTVNPNDSGCSFSGRITSQRPLLNHGNASSLNHADSCLMPSDLTSHAGDLTQSKKRSPKRQKTKKSTFNVWFGRIEITSSTTEQDVDVDSEYSRPMRLQAGRTCLKVIPSLRFLKIGLMFESGNSRPNLSHPTWDNRLRIIRTHSEDSAVANAINSADPIRFRQLLENREVSPFDFIDYGYVSESLFGMVVYTCYTSSLRHSPSDHLDRRNLLDIAKLLADSGVDCGVGTPLYNVLLSMQGFLDDFKMNLFHLIMANSQSDPFEYICGEPFNLYILDHVSPVIMKQDAWDVSEFKTSYGNYWGNGSWHFMVEKGASRSKWLDLQKQKWSQTPACLRRSRSYCLTEFGSSFVEDHWGRLCWRDKKPTFWRSKQACEEFFGEWFVQNDWPKLYWKEEVPSFWRSKQTCEEFFGEYVVLCNWPKFLGEKCFEFLEGKGAFRYYEYNFWDEETRNEWITELINCWLEDTPVQRHSRQHCIDQYGTYFVQDELPSLLRKDGLPEEDVLRLTEQGPDMDPPSPRPYWEDEYESESESEEFGADDEESGGHGEEYGDDEEGEVYGDSDGEISDGWETADEG